MKKMDIFCASQASTAICSSMDHNQKSIVRSHSIGSSSRAIDRHNPLLRDSRRYSSSSSRNLIQNPTSPSYHQIQPSNIKPKYNNTNQNKKKKNTTKIISTKPITNLFTNTRKSSAKPIIDLFTTTTQKSSDLFSPPASTRYLLSDTTFFDIVSDFDPPVSDVDRVPPELAQIETEKEVLEETPVLKKSPSDSTITRSPDQVVVLRVSLHCKGCEGKVRKHISRMKGVKSFNIDFKAKKVTVVGDVTPVEVLESVSRVKNAQFWPSPLSVGSR